LRAKTKPPLDKLEALTIDEAVGREPVERLRGFDLSPDIAAMSTSCVRVAEQTMKYPG
jgi:hypothetical protein